MDKLVGANNVFGILPSKLVFTNVEIHLLGMEAIVGTSSFFAIVPSKLIIANVEIHLLGKEAISILIHWFIPQQ